MTDKHIIFIPGKNPETETSQHRELLWKTLLEGVRRADTVIANTIQTHITQFHLISWNHLFYHTYIDVSNEIPWINALLSKSGPTKQDMQEANSWRNRLGRLIMSFADNVPMIIPLLPSEIENTAMEINRYFNNIDNIGSNIREILKMTLLPLIEKKEPVLIIGHSLGSVIAYDTLWELSQQEEIKEKIDLFTIGSPLGLHYVQKRLKGMNGNDEKSYPKLIRHWINLSSEGDMVALDRNLRDSFSDMLKLGLVTSIEDHSHSIYNYYRSEGGLDSHRAYGYMVNPEVGNIIANWWRRN